MTARKSDPNDYKKLFVKLGTCSRTMFFVLNREFDHHREPEERASDPLAGGIMQQGYQCGMLWGSALAVGSESFRRNEDSAQAITTAITATQHIMESFQQRTDTVDCLDITSCDWTSKISMAKYFFSGKFISCFKLIEKWAPEAIQSANEGLSQKPTECPCNSMNCASEVVRKMGGNAEEVVKVAGFAGGLGLSGNACGALSAAIWMNSLAWCEENPGKSAMSNPHAAKTLEAFQRETDFEFICSKISGQSFNTFNEHTKYIENGGCKQLIDALSETSQSNNHI